MVQTELASDAIAMASPPSSAQEDRFSRKSREREQRREEILRASAKLFSERGYERTTMAEIAAASEFAVGTLYKFFRDKRDLYQTLLAETVHDYERQLVQALGGPGDEIERLHRFLDVGSQLFVKHLGMSRVYFSQSSAAFLFASGPLEDEPFLSYQRIVAAVTEVFRSGVERGLFVSLDPALLAMGLEGVHNGFLAALVRDPNSFTPSQIAEYTKKMFFESVIQTPPRS